MTKETTRGPRGEGSTIKWHEPTKRFRCYITVDGARKYIYGSTERECATNKRNALTLRDAGTLVVGREYTVAQWIEHFMSISSHLAPSTRATYENAFNRFVIPALGKYKLSALQPEHVEKMFQGMLDGSLSGTGRGVGISMIRQAHSPLRKALNVAMARGKVMRNVATLVELPRIESDDDDSDGEDRDVEAFSIEDAKVILAAADRDPYRARWYIALMMGLRPGEALGLSWDNVDLDAGTLRVRNQLQWVQRRGLIFKRSAKTRKGKRPLFIPPSIIPMLREVRQRQMENRIKYGEKYVEWEWNGQPVPLVFTLDDGRPVTPRIDTARWAKLLSSTGLDHSRRYTARHTAATFMLAAGVPIEVVSANMGHARTSFTYDTYVHPLTSKKKEAATAMDSMFT